MKKLFDFGLLLTVVLAVGCQGRFRGTVEPQPLPYETKLKELIANGFEGTVLGFPEQISGTLGPEGQWLFGDKPEDPGDYLGDVSPFYHRKWYEIQRNFGRVEKIDRKYTSVFWKLSSAFYRANKRKDKKEAPDKRADWAFRGIRSVKGGDIKDFEVFYEESTTTQEEWVPYLLFYWRHTLDVEIKRRAVYMRPRFKEGVNLDQQLKALGIEYANPVWVHPRVGMIYQVVKPSPKKPVFIMTTTPKLGPPRIEAVMDGIAPEVAESFGFEIYQSIEKTAFYLLNEGKNAEKLHLYEPFLACHVLNKDIQENLAKIVKTAQSGDQTAVTSAFAALKNSKNLDTYPLILLDAEKAAYEHGLLTESQKKLLLGYALKTIERFDAKIKDCQKKKLFATEAGYQWIKSAFVGVPVEDEKALNVEVQSLYGKPQPSAADGTPLQVALANMIKLLPIPKVSGGVGGMVSDNLVLVKNASQTGRLDSYLSPDNFESRKSAGAPVWDFKLPDFKLSADALKVRTETRTENLPYRVYTKEYAAYMSKLSDLKRRADIAYKSIPVKNVAYTRSEYGPVKYVSGGMTVGVGYAYRPVTTTSTGLDFSSRQYKLYSSLKAQVYSLEYNPPKNKYLKKYLAMPVSYQIWNMEKESWDVQVSYRGKVIGNFPVDGSFKSEFKRHAGSSRHGIRAVDEWTNMAKMRATLESSNREKLSRRVFQGGSLRSLDFTDFYLKTLHPKLTDQERATEAAWLRFWFLNYHVRLSEISKEDQQRLPMGLLELIHKNRTGLDLTSISSSYPAREASERSSNPLVDLDYKRDFEMPPLVIDRPGRLSKNKVHLEVSLENLHFTLVLANDLESFGATLTTLNVRAKSKGKKLKYDVCVGDSRRSPAGPLYGFLSKQVLFKLFGRFGKRRIASCPKCGRDNSLKGPDGKTLDWGPNLIHISD